MEPVTIAALGCAGIAVIVAGISSERARVWKHKALTASRFHVEACFAERRALDETARLKNLLADVEHQAAMDAARFERRFIEKAGVLSTTMAELTEVRAKLAERIQRDSANGRKARQAQLAMQAAKRAATTQALRECVEARG